MKTILVTGSQGFIGKNLHHELQNREYEVLSIDSSSSESQLEESLLKADFIIHTAGVNRPKDESDFEVVNKGLTEKITTFLKKENKKTPILITSSAQATLDNPYGKSKAAAEEELTQYKDSTGAKVYIYRLPGVFGKWSKPNYNSVVATFCNNIANGLPVTINDPSYNITLVYIDDVVKEFLSKIESSGSGVVQDIYEVQPTFTLSLNNLHERILAIHDIRTSLVVPNLEDKLNKYLYATYISYLAKDNFGYTLTSSSDDRGWLAEFVKSKQFGQIFISKTKPGISRGDHWHHTKIEKFLVVDGDAEIKFRNKIDEQDVITYKVSGQELTVLDIPTGFVHSITNTGNTDLTTIFWANEILDKEWPDTFYEKVIITGDK